MRKHNLFRYCLLLIMAAIGLTASASDAGVIYLVDWGKPINGAPIKDNEDQFTKLYETESGSRVYTGIHDFWSQSWFRFYSELQDGPEYSWRLNNICPLVDEAVVTQKGKSGIFFATNVHDTHHLSPMEEPGTWTVSAEGRYEITVDLNAGTLLLVPVDDLLVAFDDSSRPEPDNYANYFSFSTLNKYAEPGDLKIYFYSPYRKEWLNTEGMEVAVKYGDFYTVLNENNPSATGSAFEVNGWPGGVIRSSVDYWDGNKLTFRPDGGWNPGTFSGERVYIVGDGTWWSFSEDYSFAATDASGMTFNVTIPAGMSQFKFTLAPDWGGIDFGADSVSKNDAGEFVVSVVQFSSNFSFDSALEAPIDGVLNLKDMTLTLPASAPLTVTQEYNPNYSDYLFISTPDDNFEMWDTAPFSIYRQFNCLRKTGENEWKGELYITEKNKRFNFISSLTAKGQPNMKLAPASGSDVSLEYIDGYAYASATVQNENEAAWWSFLPTGGKSNIGHKVELTVTRHGDKYSLVVDDKNAVGGGKIYIVGSPIGWDINSDAMPLQLTDKGGYYGSHTFPAGDNFFRFYTELGDWGSDGQFPSIGANSEDNDVYYVNFSGYYTGPCTPGKGSWVINSTGEPIYFYVDLNSWNVIFSSSPIAEAGNIIEEVERNPVKEGLFVSVDGGKKIELEEIHEGIYSYKPESILCGTHTYRFFTRLLPVSAAEPEWAGAYTVGLKGSGVADMTATNQTEFDIEISNETGTVPATPLTLILDDDVLYHQGEIVVDLNYGRLYVIDYEKEVLVIDGHLPWVTDANKQADRLLGEHGGIVNIPEGKFDVEFYSPGMPGNPELVEHISFADDPFAYANNGTQYGWRFSRLIADDWHGGPVYISPTMAYDLSKLNSISAVIYTGLRNISYTMTETAPGSMIYKGTVDLIREYDYGDGSTNHHSLYFQLALKNAMITYPYGEYDTRLEISLGSPCVVYNNAGIYSSNPDKAYIGFADKKAESKVYFGARPFFFTNVTSDSRIEVTLDLNTMTMNATFIDGDLTTGYETVGTASSTLDGAVSYCDATTPSVSFLDVPELAAGGYDFNLATDRNTVIVPASGATTVVTFDASGTWQGSYNEVPSPAAANAPASMTRAVLRNSAAQQAQWHFDVPADDFTALAIAIDERTKTMTIHSMAHNKGFFTVVNSVYPRADKISEARGQMLMPTGTEGVYVGHFELTEPTDSWSSLAFVSHPMSKFFVTKQAPYGILPDILSQDASMIDVTAADPAVVPAWHTYTRNGQPQRTLFSRFAFTAQPGIYEVIYDSRDHTLSVSTNITGIDDVTADGFAATGITLTPGTGCVAVTTPEATRVDFYAVSGVLVKSVEVPAGTTTVTIAPGFYITSGKKIVVR